MSGIPDLAHVVQGGRVLDEFDELRVQAHAARDDFRVATHADDVPARLVVSIFRCAGQAVNQLQTRGGQFGGAASNLFGKLAGVVFQMVVVRLDHQGVAHADHEFGGVHRFAQKIRGPKLQGLEFDLDVVEGRADQRGNIRQSARPRGCAAGFPTR